jgi:flap endonuclease-1
VGVNLTSIINKQKTTLSDLKGRKFAVDAYNILHQFLALIRTREGTLLKDSHGRVTSHLVGLAFRSTRLMLDYRMKLVFVFDGKPPELKKEEIKKRSKTKKEAEKEYYEAVKKGDYKTAWSKAVQTGRLARQNVVDAKHLLGLLGIPWIQAPGEGEAQAAFLAKEGDAWATNSRDFDSLLFGSPRLVRYITIQGKKWLPTKGVARRLEPELMDLNEVLNTLNIQREQLIDLSILIGTDYNEGIKGIGPKTALKLIKKYEKIENLPKNILDKTPKNLNNIRQQYLNPNITTKYSLKPKNFQEEKLRSFLCDERDFSTERVKVLIKRLRKSESQSSLKNWMED